MSTRNKPAVFYVTKSAANTPAGMVVCIECAKHASVKQTIGAKRTILDAATRICSVCMARISN